MASSRRVFLLAEGLAEAGHKVQILVLNPTEVGGSVPRPVAGVMPSGVAFRYTGGECVWARSWFRRRLQNAAGLMGAVRFCWRCRAQLDVLGLFESDLTAGSIIVRLTGGLFARRSVLLVNEHPFCVPHNAFRTFLVRKVMGRLYDGYVLISRGIAEFFCELGTPAQKLLRLPIVADDPVPGGAPHLPANETANERRMVFYCGDWSEQKDGLLTLIRAFAVLAPRFPDLCLELAGKPSQSGYLGVVMKLTADLGLENRVRVLGYLAANEFAQHRAASIMFVLPKPDNFQARYSMPSKLAEYLMTGRPVIVSEMGDLRDYLESGVSAYFVPPGSVVDTAAAMTYVLTHPDEARAVGAAGRTVAVEVFHYRVNALRLAAFFDGLRGPAAGAARL